MFRFLSLRTNLEHLIGYDRVVRPCVLCKNSRDSSRETVLKKKKIKKLLGLVTIGCSPQPRLQLILREGIRPPTRPKHDRLGGAALPHPVHQALAAWLSKGP